MTDSDPVQIHDDGASLRRYFMQIPNLLDDSDLSPHAFRVYCHLKRRAGANHGVCKAGTRAIASHCNLGVATVSRAKEELVSKGLIVVTQERKPGATELPDTIRLVDIWAKNFAHYAPKTLPIPTGNTPVPEGNTPVPEGNTPVPEGNTKKNVLEEPKEEEHRESEASPPSVASRPTPSPKAPLPETSGEATPPVKPKPSKPTPTRIPEDFAPDPDLLAWAAIAAPNTDLDAATEAFIDYWTSSATPTSRKADWRAAWRTWIRNCADRGQYLRASQRPERAAAAPRASQAYPQRPRRMSIDEAAVEEEEALQSMAASYHERSPR